MTCIKSKKTKQNKKPSLDGRCGGTIQFTFIYIAPIQELPQGTFILKSKDPTILERNGFSSGLAGLDSCVKPKVSLDLFLTCMKYVHVNVTVWGEGLRERIAGGCLIFSDSGNLFLTIFLPPLALKMSFLI